MTVRSSRGGMTLVEVVIAFGVLLGGTLVLAQSIAGSMRVSRDAHERAHVRRAAEDRLGELRATLHAQDWTAPVFNQATHDQQFQGLLAEHGTSRTLPLEGGHLATVAVALTRDEQTAASYARLAAAIVDLDKDGAAGQAGDRPLAGLIGVGVEITVTWRGAAGRADDPTRSYRIGTILY